MFNRKCKLGLKISCCSFCAKKKNNILMRILNIARRLKTILKMKNIRQMEMKNSWSGQIDFPHDELNLDLTLLGGQSFRWEKCESNGKLTVWSGVAYDAYWELTQNNKAILYKVSPLKRTEAAEEVYSAEYFQNLLRKYFRADFDLKKNVAKWKSDHEHFLKTAQTFNAVRVLDQEPLENILSFICSQNNHIRRISTMINWMCSKYGSKIGSFNGKDQFAFPSLENLMKNHNQLELQLREAKFGYRAKFIAQTVGKISESGGMEWLYNLKKLPYAEARLELVTLPGIGFKVADCICLMSLNHLESVPIDTHIFKIAQASYMPQLAKTKSVTPKIYEEISAHFQKIYGKHAGWAQAVLFCSGLQQFQSHNKPELKISQPGSKKKKIKASI